MEEEWDVMVIRIEVNQPHRGRRSFSVSIAVLVDLWNEYYFCPLCSCIICCPSLSTKISGEIIGAVIMEDLV